MSHSNNDIEDLYTTLSHDSQHALAQQRQRATATATALGILLCVTYYTCVIFGLPVRFWIRRMLGRVGTLPGATKLRRLSAAAPPQNPVLGSCCDSPAGMGNWDNSCYQNSVVQGLASLTLVFAYLDAVLQRHSALSEHSTSSALRNTIRRLNFEGGQDRVVWMPAKLKSMSSMQQQDAHEYFSKILEEAEKEIKRDLKARATSPGLEAEMSGPLLNSQLGLSNPLEGLMAQRVACTRCDYSEGLSMIPFICLTVPLGNGWSYDVRDCLDECTALETIEGVECAKCTLLRSQAQLKTMHERIAAMVAPDPALMDSISARLRAVQDALDSDDFSDNTLSSKCQIGKKNWMSTTKSRQAVVARAPKSLVLHVNRSVFDEMTGDMRKNHAHVLFPALLDLSTWCLGARIDSRVANERNVDEETWAMNPSQSMLPTNSKASASTRVYALRAVVTHYGRHENGHYICYRKHGSAPAQDEKEAPPGKWWKLSDEVVTEVSEEQVLQQGGVFMLFYEQIDVPEALDLDGILKVASDIPLPLDNDSIEADFAEMAAAIPLPCDEESIEMDLLGVAAGNPHPRDANDAELLPFATDCAEPDQPLSEEQKRVLERDAAAADALAQNKASLLEELQAALPKARDDQALSGEGMGLNPDSPDTTPAASSTQDSESEQCDAALSVDDSASCSISLTKMRTAGLTGSQPAEDSYAQAMLLGRAY